MGYGSMLIESALAVLAIVACCAGLGLGLLDDKGVVLTGAEAWQYHYASWGKAGPLAATINAFIIGGGHFLEKLGLPLDVCMTMMAVIIVSFAGTTLDTATRIQRYVINELGRGARIGWLQDRTIGTTIAVASAAALALYKGGGQGGMALWPVFGTVNQLLAGLALMAVTLFLLKLGRPVWYTLVPMLFVLAVTGWAMVLNIRSFVAKKDLTLLIVATAVFALEIGVLAAGVRAWVRLRGARAGALRAAAAGLEPGVGDGSR